MTDKELLVSWAEQSAQKGKSEHLIYRGRTLKTKIGITIGKLVPNKRKQLGAFLSRDYEHCLRGIKTPVFFSTLWAIPVPRHRFFANNIPLHFMCYAQADGNITKFNKMREKCAKFYDLPTDYLKVYEEIIRRKDRYTNRQERAWRAGKIEQIEYPRFETALLRVKDSKIQTSMGYELEIGRFKSAYKRFQRIRGKEGYYRIAGIHKHIVNMLTEKPYVGIGCHTITHEEIDRVAEEVL